MEPETYYSVKEVAERLGVAPSTVYRYFHSGIFTRFQIQPAKKIRISKTEVDALVGV